MDLIYAQDGTPIHYAQLGCGRPIIFLHGWTADAREWLPFATELADQFTVFCWNARGHGQGKHISHPDSDTHIHHMASDLDRLISHHQLEDVILVGHSMGALTSWHYIREYGTQALSGLCLIDQSPRLETDSDWSEGVYGNFDATQNARFIELLNSDFAEAVLQLAANGHNQRSRESYENNTHSFQKMREYLQQLPADKLIQTWISFSREDYRDVLPAIDIPALLIHGDESQFYSLDLARWVNTQIPDSQLFIYEGADHNPHARHKARFIEQLKSFATSAPGRRQSRNTSQNHA